MNKVKSYELEVDSNGAMVLLNLANQACGACLSEPIKSTVETTNFIGKMCIA